MTYLLTALHAEALPFIDYFALKKSMTSPFKIFENENMRVAIIGVGRDSALISTAFLLGRFEVKESDLIVNIGMAAAPKSYAIGEMLLINRATDAHSLRSFYPDMLYRHPFKEAPIRTALSPQTTMQEAPVDMEASSIMRVALKFIRSDQIAILKVVSDYFSSNILSKKEVYSLFLPHLKEVENLILTMQKALKKEPLFLANELESHQKIIEQLKLTMSQQSRLKDALYFAKLSDRNIALEQYLTLESSSKLERSMHLESLIRTLTN